jgi:hypothetical protein
MAKDGLFGSQESADDSATNQLDAEAQLLLDDNLKQMGVDCPSQPSGSTQSV